MGKVQKEPVKYLKEAVRIEEVRKHFEQKILDADQILSLEKIVRDKTTPEDDYSLFIQGFRASEIAEFRSVTRQAVSANIKSESQKVNSQDQDESKEKHKTNRKKLIKAAEWYWGVYITDQRGTFDHIEDLISVQAFANKARMAKLYYELGGNKMDFDLDELDGRIRRGKNNQIKNEAFRLLDKGKGWKDLKEDLGLTDSQVMYYIRAWNEKLEKEIKS
ncbi:MULTISPECIES: hypothetical protein [Bacillus]|uniref:hypothetical protein n=1 Tax=Bacillus TaxID=1386 RepID=UPI001ABDD5D7|nr:MULTISPECIES: hypothetical protein [Bacillus subtilis group]MCB4338868.1 hypothetical protein [Bacillus subtilis]QTG87187.1 hypothetical protein J4048_21225 [Bacillus amyloliquefaciens]